MGNLSKGCEDEGWDPKGQKKKHSNHKKKRGHANPFYWENIRTEEEPPGNF